MKVKDLVKILLTFDQELDIVINGYEGGVTEYVHVETAKVACDIHKEWYYGEHEVDSEYYQDIKPDEPRKNVIAILRVDF